jgi:cysteine desulfurase family protein (TIGR01976 family)
VTSLDKSLLDAIRKEFPRVEADANGRRRIYFENGAGSLVLQRAAVAELRARIDYSANVGGPSWESKMNEQVITEGRKAVADFLNAPSEACIFAGESSTSQLFHLSYAMSKEMSGTENIVLTEYEHYANVSPWLELQRRGVIKEVRFARFNPEDGMLDMEHLASLLDNKTKLVAVSGISNVMGSKTPVNQVFRIAKQVEAYTVLDAVHMAAHTPIDLAQMNCDFAVFSAYKLFSRRGSFMYGRKELLESLKPYKVAPSPDKIPDKWETGTQDQALFASITAVMDYLSWLGGQIEHEFADTLSRYTRRRRLLKAALQWIEKYEQTLSKAMLDGVDNTGGLNTLKEVKVYGLRDSSKLNQRGPTFSFNVGKADALKVAEYLWDKYSIALLAENGGGFYSRTLKTYGESVAVRASLLHFNTVEEVEVFLKALSDTAKRFGSQQD